MSDPSRRLRLLVVMPFLPVPANFGGKVRLHHVLRELARRHDVTLVAYASREEMAERATIESWGVRVVTFPHEVVRRPWRRHLRYLLSPVPFRLVDPLPAFAELVRQTWLSGQFDAVQTEFLGLYFAVQDRVFDGRRFMTLHCSTTDDSRRELRIQPRTSPRHWYVRFELLKLPFYERRAIEACERVFVTSATDRDLIGALVPGRRDRFVVANNGVDIEQFEPLPDPGGPPTVVSTCSFVTDANLDGVMYYLREVWPRVTARVPSARYRIVGHQPPEALRALARSTPGVDFVGEVDDVRPYLAGARASLVIMRAGSGTKIRAFTSLAMGVPLIATPLGAEGIEATPADGLRVAATTDALVEATVEALGQPVDPAVAERARAFVARHHSWQQVAERMTEAYLEVLGRAGRARSAGQPAA